MNEPAQPAPVGKPIRYLSVCSGMEAASVAWHPLGWKPVGFSEIEPFPCAILKHRFPDVPNYGSLTEYQSWPLEPGAIDLLVGGTPCQSFSVAGLRKGLADPRGNLALTFLGLADKLKPKWIVWENVPGVLSSGEPKGSDFGAFLGALVQLGYGFAYRVLDAQHFGVPQRRRRVFVVACLGDWRAASEVLSLREGLSGYLASGGKKRKNITSDAGESFDADGLQRTVGTLCADTHPGAYTGQDAHTGRLIPQTFTPSSFGQYSEGIGTIRANGGDLGGGSEGLVIKPLSHWDGSDVHPTLNQSAKGSGGVGASNQELFSQGGAYLVPGQPIPFRKSKRAQSVTDNETWVLADSSNTLNNFDLGDTRTTHAVVEPIPLDLRNAGRDPEKKDEMNRQGLGVGQPGEPYHTITSAFVHGVAHEQKVYENHPNDSRITGPLDVAPTVVSRFGTGGGNVPLVGANVASPQGVDLYNQTLTGDIHVPLRTAGGHGAPACMTPMAVRRLTPVECERLQGFPDNWSRIVWKGKPEEDCPDGPRYKACGNSMAVPVMSFIGNRIADYEAKA